MAAVTVVTNDPIVTSVEIGTVVGSPAFVTANDTAQATRTYTPLPARAVAALMLTLADTLPREG